MVPRAVTDEHLELILTEGLRKLQIKDLTLVSFTRVRELS
jgi:hypothetical protein